MRFTFFFQFVNVLKTSFWNYNIIESNFHYEGSFKRIQKMQSGYKEKMSINRISSLVAWVNDAGVKVYDTANDQRITFIEKPRGSPRPELLLPHLVWQVSQISMQACC